MANVQVAVWLGWKACGNFFAVTTAQIISHYIPNKVTVFGIRGLLAHDSFPAGLRGTLRALVFKKKHPESFSLIPY